MMKQQEAMALSRERTFVGLDVGGTKTALMVEKGGKILREATFPSTPHIGELKRAIESHVKSCGLKMEDVGALAMGIPGRVDPDTGLVIDAPALGWKDFSLQQKLFSSLPIPCVAENDITMSLIAETTLGKARGQSDVVFLAIGTGVGSAILANGSILSGAAHSAGEIGYCIFDSDITPHFQNKDGCFGPLESKISGKALETAAGKLGATPQELFRAYPSGDPARDEIIDKFLTRLAVTIANMTSILNPHLVVLGGGVSESLGGVLETIRERVTACTPLPVRVEISSFYNRAGAIGACQRARLLWEKEQTGGRMTAAV